MTGGELTRMLLRVDESALSGKAADFGPFSVFEAAETANTCYVSGDSADDFSATTGAISDTANPSSSDDSPRGAEETRQIADLPDYAQPQMTGHDASDVALDLSQPETSDGRDRAIVPAGPPRHWKSSSASNTSTKPDTEGSDETEIVLRRPSAQIMRPDFHFYMSASDLPIVPSPPMSKGICDLSPTASMLMHHYAKSMVHLMQPIFHESSPFEKIYLPLAMAGSANISDFGALATSISPSAAVCHSLLSAAANNMRTLGSAMPGLRKLAWQHKQKALTALRSALESRSSKYRELMVAILSLVSADLLDGGVDDHWIHLEAGRQLQASRHFTTVVSHETRQLDSICKMLRLFSQTTLCDPEPDVWPGNHITIKETDASTLSPSIEYLYGITSSTAGCIMKTYRLTQMLAHYNLEPLPYNDDLLQACEDVGDELASWTLSSLTFSTLGPGYQQMLSIAREQETAFHAATQIYYGRSVQSCPRGDLAVEQRAAIKAMNEAEDLKTALGGSVSFPAPITWPAFISSCEAVGEVRQDWIAWWQRIQAYQMRSYTQQFHAVREVWAYLDEHPERTMDWRSALYALNIRILPV